MTANSILISGGNKLSIKLAHAKALNMLKDNVSKINMETRTFIITAETENQLDICNNLSKWCANISKFTDNSLDIDVEALETEN